MSSLLLDVAGITISYLCMSIYLYIYIYTYVSICVFICIYIYTYVHTCRNRWQKQCKVFEHMSMHITYVNRCRRNTLSYVRV